jgi:hypothetical protein
VTVSEALEQVKFVVGADGQPTAAMLDIEIYRMLVAMLEEAEDQGLLRAYLARRRNAQSPEELNLVAWEEAEAVLDARGDADNAPYDDLRDLFNRL